MRGYQPEGTPTCGTTPRSVRGLPGLHRTGAVLRPIPGQSSRTRPPRPQPWYVWPCHSGMPLAAAGTQCMFSRTPPPQYKVSNHPPGLDGVPMRGAAGPERLPPTESPGRRVCDLLESRLARPGLLESRLARGLLLESRLARANLLEMRLASLAKREIDRNSLAKRKTSRCSLAKRDSSHSALAKRKTDRTTLAKRDFGRSLPRQT